MGHYIGDLPVWVVDKTTRVVSGEDKLTIKYLTTDLSGYPAPSDTKLEYGKPCPIAGYEHLVINDFKINTTGTAVLKVTVSFGLEAEGDIIDSWYRNDIRDERPLEENKNYKTCWNYHLAKLSTETLDSFTNWNTVTDTIIPGAAANSFRWLKDPSDLLEGWVICQYPTKPGRETFPFLTFQVVNEKKYNSRGAAESAAETAFSNTAPPVRFKLDSTAAKWLKQPGGIRPDGRYWTVTTLYDYNDDEFDTDLF